MTDSGIAPVRITLESPEDTARIGAALGRWLRPGDLALLHGDLGAGKTTLTQGIARGLGIVGAVASPSFALVHEYAVGAGRLLHLDLYRLHDASDLESIGFADISADPDAIVLVEWPERAGNALGDHYLLLELQHAGEHARVLVVSGTPSEAWAARWPALREAIGAP